MPKLSDGPRDLDPAFKLHILVTESKSDLLKIVAGIKSSIQPVNYLEDLAVNTIVNRTFDELRYIRIKAGILNNAIRRALVEVLTMLQLPPCSGISSEKNHEPATAMAYCVQVNDELKRRVESILQEVGHDWTTVEAYAFNSCSGELAKVDRLLRDASEARDRALRSVPRLRKDFARELRAASDRVLEVLAGAEFPDDARPS